MISKYLSDFKICRAIQSTLFKNYFFLSLYQIVNFAVPLIIVPIIINTVGVSNFGHIAFSYAFVNYFNILVDYGFNLSATRKISVNRNDKKIVETTFTTVYISKLMLFFTSFLLYAVLLYLFPVLRQQWVLHIFSFAIVVGQALIPVWLFQGMEDMKYLALCNILSKLTYFICILAFIRLPQDYYLVNFLQGITAIGAGLVSLYICFRKFDVWFIPVAIDDVLNEIKEGRTLFISSLAVNIYVNSNAFILGLFASPAEVGLYSISERVYFALKQLDSVFGQVIFPQVCILAQQSLYNLRTFFKRIFPPFVVLITVVCILVSFIAPFISAYFLKGEINKRLILLIYFFCITVFINAFNTPTFQTLLACNEKKKVGWILFFGCLINIIANIVLVNLFQSFGSAFSVLITELFITFGLGYYFFDLIKHRSHEIPHPL